MKNFISICAWCQSIKTPLGWQKKLQAYQVLGIHSDEDLDQTHGICPTCAEQWTKIDPRQFLSSCRREALLTVM